MLNTCVAKIAVEWRGPLCSAVFTCHSDVRAECRLHPRDPFGSDFHCGPIVNVGCVSAAARNAPARGAFGALRLTPNAPYTVGHGSRAGMSSVQSTPAAPPLPTVQAPVRHGRDDNSDHLPFSPACTASPSLSNAHRRPPSRAGTSHPCGLESPGVLSLGGAAPRSVPNLGHGCRRAARPGDPPPLVLSPLAIGFFEPRQAAWVLPAQTKENDHEQQNQSQQADPRRLSRAR